AGSTAPVPVALSDVTLLAGDPVPYDLTRWAAGNQGNVYFLAQPNPGSGSSAAHLFEHSTAGLRSIAMPGLTPVLGTTPALLSQLSDFVVNGANELFLEGVGTSPGVFQLQPSGSAASPDRLLPVVTEGETVPRNERSGADTGLIFDGDFFLVPQ